MTVKALHLTTFWKEFKQRYEIKCQDASFLLQKFSISNIYVSYSVLFYSEHFAYFVPMEIVKNITELIKAERKSRGLSQEGLAFKSEVGRAYMSTVENGQRNISIQMLHQIITEGLEMKLSDFFLEYEKKYPSNKK